jgi:multicomponent Na+:H+ antiporter subunit D
VKTNLFLIAGAVRWLRGTADLKKLGGLVKTNPFLSALFLISGLALAGVPPLSGFWAKLLLTTAGFEAQMYIIVIVALIVGFLTLFAVIRMWSLGFWNSAPQQMYHPRDFSRRELLGHIVPIAVLTVAIVLIGLSAETIYTLAQATADQLLDPTQYISAVLGS